MSKEQTEKSSFLSKYDGGFITPAQYLAEMMCTRMAKKEKKDLSSKFWNNDDKWKKMFLTQIRFANSLLKLYSIEAIISVLKSKKYSWVFSLGFKGIDLDIQAEQERLSVGESLVVKETEVTKVDKVEKPRDNFYVNKNTLNTLRDI